MWKVILAAVPWNVVLPWVVSRVSDISYKGAKALIDKAFDLVIQVEDKYGDGNGQEKFQEVKKNLLESFQDISGWVINLVIEMAVAQAKKKGLVK